MAYKIVNSTDLLLVLLKDYEDRNIGASRFRAAREGANRLIYVEFQIEIKSFKDSRVKSKITQPLEDNYSKAQFGVFYRNIGCKALTDLKSVTDIFQLFYQIRNTSISLLVYRSLIAKIIVTSSRTCYQHPETLSLLGLLSACRHNCDIF